MAMQNDKEVRCSSPAVTYGEVLYGLHIPDETVKKTQEIFDCVPQLLEIFMNPTIALRKKLSVIDRVFPKEIKNFLKTACKYRRMNLMNEIFTAYQRCKDKEAKILHAVLRCTTPPSEEQMKGMESFLCRKYGADKAQIKVRKDDSLLGGFILSTGSDEYDWSIKGRLNRLEQTLTWR